jgi:hypothetical protein
MTTLAYAILAVIGQSLEGPDAAYMPASFAMAGLLVLGLERRYPYTLKQWSRRRIIETTAVFALAVAVLIGGLLLVDPDLFPSWMFIAMAIVPIPALVIDGVGFLKREFRPR